MKKILLVTAAALALPMLAMAQSDSMSNSTAASSPSAAKFSAQDHHFIKLAAIAGTAEVTDGRLAASKGDAAVKAVGETMVTDHTAANDKLMALVKQNDMTPPMTMDPAQTAATAQLQGLSGAAFDHKYLSSQLVAHEKAIATFKTEAALGSDPDLKAFASSTLPTLQQHLSMIKTAMK